MRSQPHTPWGVELQRFEPVRLQSFTRFSQRYFTRLREILIDPFNPSRLCQRLTARPVAIDVTVVSLAQACTGACGRGTQPCRRPSLRR